MDKTALLIISGPSLIMTGYYCLCRFLDKKPILGGDCFDVFWKSCAFMGCVLLMVSQFVDPVKAWVGNSELYMLAAGISVCIETGKAVKGKFTA